MTINYASGPGSAAAGTTAASPRRGRLVTVTGAVGVGYALCWVAGLAVPAPSPPFGASGRQIITALSGHGAALAVQFALTEGLPAAGIAVVAVGLARAGATTRTAAARMAMVAGLAAALISLTQFCLGMVLAQTTAASAPGTVHLLYETVNRLDGGKMLALAVLGGAAAAAVALPRWLRYLGAALGVTIAASGVVYLLLLQGLAVLAGPALVLLLAFIAGAGIWLGGRDR